MEKKRSLVGRYQIRQDYIKVETSIAPQVALTTPTQSDNFWLDSLERRSKTQFDVFPRSRTTIPSTLSFRFDWTSLNQIKSVGKMTGD